MSDKPQGAIRWHSRVGGPYAVEAILPHLVAGETRELDGFRVKFGSVRLQTFPAGTVWRFVGQVRDYRFKGTFKRVFDGNAIV